MKHFITLLVMAILMAGAADAKVVKGQTKTKKATTTATHKTKAKTKNRPAPQPILPPQREITEEMLRYVERNDELNWTFSGESLIRESYKKALQGDAQKQFRIGLDWTTGSFGEEDKDEALRWYYLAALQGHGEACFYVANAYCDEYCGWYNLKRNYFEAAKWYAKAKKAGNPYADSDLGLLLEYGKISKEEFRIATEQAELNTQEALQDAVRAEQEVAKRVKNEEKHTPYYGTWTSARGATFTIERGPYLTLRGAGKFKGEWTSDGRLHVDFGYPDEITLKYSNGYLYDRDGRMHWKIY